MIDGKFNIKIEDFADALANSCDEEQSEFFNIFFKSLRLACETEYKFDMQLSSIYLKLNERSKKSCQFLTFED